MPYDGSAGPLAGVRVLDLSRLLPGGYCTLLMADLGADVVKVEEPGSGDGLRSFPPYATTGESGAFLALNRGKRSVTCNLKSAGGVGVLRDLATTADVLVESFRPGVMDRLGVGFPALRTVNPGLVYAAVSGYGADGPYADRAGHDINYLAVGGGLGFSGAPSSGAPSSGPWQPGLQIGDLGGGLLALVAVLAALRVRDRTGEGQFCDVSMTDSVLSWLTIHAGAYAVSGRSPQVAAEPLNGGLACYGVYACSDGRHVALGALEAKFFGPLLTALSVPELADWQYDGVRQAELRERLAAIFSTRSRDEWVAELANRDVCLSPVNTIAEAYADPGLRARGMVLDLALADGTSLPVPGVVPRLSDTPGRPGAAPSRLGADTAVLLAETGRGPAEIAALRAEGAI